LELSDSPKREILDSESEDVETENDTDSNASPPEITPRGKMQTRGSKSTPTKTPMAKAPAGKPAKKQGGSSAKKVKKG